MDMDIADSQELKELQFNLPLVSNSRRALPAATLLKSLKVCESSSPQFSSTLTVNNSFGIDTAGRARRMGAKQYRTRFPQKRFKAACQQ